jgi:hypothetical protein
MASDDDPVGKSTEPRAGASAPEPAHESVLPAGAQPLGDVRERLWQRVGGAPLAVLVDNTTCFNCQGPSEFPTGGQLIPHVPTG